MKRLVRGLLFPPAWVLCTLPPAVFACLIAAAVRGVPQGTALYILYALSAYALTLWALAVPRLLRTVRRAHCERRAHYVRRAHYASRPATAEQRRTGHEQIRKQVFQHRRPHG